MTPPPITSATIPDEWLASVHEAPLVAKSRIQAHPTLPRLQAWSQNTNSWHDLMLFGSGLDFASTEERDAVIGRLRKL